MANKFTISTVFSAVNHMTTPMQKMIADVERMGSKFSKAMAPIKNGFSAIGKFAKTAGMAIGAAGVGIGLLSKNAAQYGDDLNDMAAILGTTTQALEEYRFAGSLVGIEADAMDAALQKLTVNLGKGGDATNEALAKIGVSSEMLKKAGPDKVLEVIADGFQRLKSPQDKAAVASALFGKSSVKLVNVLSKGSGAIADLRKEANDLGAVMSSEAVEQAGLMDDAWTRMTASAKGLKNRLGQVVFPQLTVLVKGVTDFLKVNGEKIGQVFKGIGDVVSGVFNYVGQILSKIKPDLSFIPKVMENVGRFFEQIRPALEKIAQVIMSLVGPALEFISSKLTSLTPIFNGVANVFGIFENVFNALLPILETLWPVVDILAGAFELLTGALKTVSDILVPLIRGITGQSQRDITALLMEEQLAKSKDPNRVTSDTFGDDMMSAVLSGKRSDGSRIPTIDKVVGNSNAAGAVSANAGAFDALRSKVGIPVSPNSGVIESTKNINNRSTVDLNFNNPPAGATLRQSGAAPGVNLNMGRTGK